MLIPERISLLSEELISKIAAGEVVERPASIVKELLENALDAGATEVTINLEKGGCGSIHLSDNGCGIEPEDVPLAFKSFATSKIRRFDDLDKVGTFGFRGEALPSISSISRVELLTRKHAALCGIRAVIEAGMIKEITEVGCPVGSSIKVSHIFDPVPVRKKFLKTETTEQNYCLDVITRLVLPQPHLRVKVQAGSRKLLYVPTTRNLTERISLLFGPEMAKNILPVEAVREGATLTGYISRPDWTRSNTKQVFFYVNNRFIKDPLLHNALMTAYGHLIESRRYPVAFLFLSLLPGEVDVNVHPAKLEVRFRNPREIYKLVVETLTSALAAININMGHEDPAPWETKRPSGGYEGRVREALRRYTVATEERGKVIYRPGNKTDESPLDRACGEGLFPAIPETELKFSDLHYIGQLAGSYLLFSAPLGLVIVDQHAAHERVMLEKLKKQYNGSTRGEGQRLLLPEVISLSPYYFSLFLEIKETLQDFGLEAEPFGVDTIVVKTIPFPFTNTDARALFQDLLDIFSDEAPEITPAKKKEKILITLACRGAVMANQQLSPEEVKSLCRTLDETPFGATCPHGRPIYISLSHGELQKMFKRR